ncbi:hypothetical protein BIV59_04140 [Bacillus sp. MUM 13]|nr:hypothetical protein BIV59_04140 [Bacillus sp. MUM 13]
MCGDSCGICVTAETPQTQVEEAQRTPRGKRSILQWKSATCSESNKVYEKSLKLFQLSLTEHNE